MQFFMMSFVLVVVCPGVVPSKICNKQYLLPYKSKMCSHCADSYRYSHHLPCLLYTSDAADDLLCVDLGGRRIVKKKKKKNAYS